MTPVDKPSAELSALAELTACVNALRSEVGALRSEVRSEVGALRSEVRSEAEALRSESVEIADKLSLQAEMVDAVVEYAFEAGRGGNREDPSRPAQIGAACAAPSDAELQRVDVKIGAVRIVRGITPGSDPKTVWPSMQAAAADVPKTNRPRINRKALPGKEYQHRLVDGHLAAIDLGAEMTDLEARQAIRAAEVEHGLRRPQRRLLPIPIGAGVVEKTRGMAESHTVSTALAAALVVGGGAVGLGLYLSPDDDEQRRPQAAPPSISATRQPGTPAPAAAPRRSDRHDPIRPPAPRPELEVRPTVVAVAFRSGSPRILPIKLPSTPPRTPPRFPVPALPNPGPDAPDVPDEARCLNVRVGDLVYARLLCPAEAT